ncbi:MAG TPA: hypothetical protein VNL39_13380 [Xanthobacteraceae bacterium]|nr:hypothetical protein [Xanthobacteraceae bacterium]
MKDVSGIGVQPVASVAAAPAERKKPKSVRPSKNDHAGSDPAAPAPGTGQQVDKLA